MDVLDRLGLQTALLRARGLRRVWILTLAGWLTSCSSSTPPSTTSAPPESFNELKQRISSIRELPFKREVALAKESPNATIGTPERIFSHEYGAQSLVHISHAYKRLGLLPESTDFPAALADYVRLDRIFYYEARRDLIVISPDATQLVQAMREEPGRNLEQLPVVLALSRALQEQHFQWQGKLNGISLEDRRARLSRSGRRRHGPCWNRLSTRISANDYGRRIQSGTWPDGQPRWKKWAPIFPNCCNKS